MDCQPRELAASAAVVHWRQTIAPVYAGKEARKVQGDAGKELPRMVGVEDGWATKCSIAASSAPGIGALSCGREWARVRDRVMVEKEALVLACSAS